MKEGGEKAPTVVRGEVKLVDKSNFKPHPDVETGDLRKKIDTSVKLEFNQKFTDISHLPPLRQEYIREVWGLEETVYKLFNEGKTSEEVVRTVSQMRRDLGIKYKELTPPELRERIYARNIRALRRSTRSNYRTFKK